jgi:hypothetical protein
MILEPLRTVLASPEFPIGLRFGLIGLAIGLAAGLARRAEYGPPAAAASAGLLFAAAVALGLREALALPDGLALGLIVLAGAGAAGALPAGGLLAPVLAVPGSWLVVSGSGLMLDRWAQLLVGTAIVVGGWLVATVDASWRREGLGPVLLAISVAGVYTTVPDTEQALVALGAALPLALLGWPWPLAALGRAGAYAATGALCWVVAAGGTARGSAIVGGVACLGLFALEPAARLLAAGRTGGPEDGPRGRWAAPAAVAGHLVLVYVAARVAGLRSTVAGAVVVVLIEFLVASGLVWAATVVRSRRVAGQPSGP